jgi:hypothetical protein
MNFVSLADEFVTVHVEPLLDGAAVVVIFKTTSLRLEFPTRCDAGRFAEMLQRRMTVFLSKESTHGKERQGDGVTRRPV